MQRSRPERPRGRIRAIGGIQELSATPLRLLELPHAYQSRSLIEEGGARRLLGVGICIEREARRGAGRRLAQVESELEDCKMVRASRHGKDIPGLGCSLGVPERRGEMSKAAHPPL